MAQDLTSPYLDMWTDYEPEVYVEEKDASREWVPATALTGCEFSISDEEQGAPIGTLSGIAAPHVAGAPGHYAGSIDLATLQAQLPEVDFPHDSIVYLQFKKSGDVDVEAFQKRIRRTKY
jgi:hypothetical protein